MGYHRAGFEVVGVDINPQPRYPFEFIQADALAFVRDATRLELMQFDVIHASPPCQRYSHALKTGGDRDAHPDLIAPTRELLNAIGLPYIIENVEGALAHLIDPVLLCGSMVGIAVRRHRLFETTFPVMSPRCVHDVEAQAPQIHLSTTTRGRGKRLRGIVNAHATGATWNSEALKSAMGVEWMSASEAREAIPPVYTELIGSQILTARTTILASQQREREAVYGPPGQSGQHIGTAYARGQ